MPKSPAIRRVARHLAQTYLAIALLSAGLSPAHAAPSSGQSSAPPPWLVRINMYRAMEQLPPLENDPVLTEGSQNHAVYLVKNFARRVHDGTADNAEMSTESEARPSYSSRGRTAAPHCEVDFAYGPHQSQEAAIDRWMEGPLHRMLLLNRDLLRVGYGYYCEKSLCAQTVDVVDGLREHSIDPDQQIAIEFPPANSTLSISDLPYEAPDPLSACPGYTYPVGLPITFEIGSFVGAKLTSFSLVETDDPAASPIEACGYDAYSYRNQARNQMARVVGGLKAFSGIVVIPRRPLAPGNYRVSVTVNDNQYSWSFAIAPHDSRSAAR